MNHKDAMRDCNRLIYLLLLGLFILPASAAAQTKPPETEVQPAAPAPASTEEVRLLRDAVKTLQQQVKGLTENKADDELQAIMAEAEAEAKAPEDEIKPGDREHLWGALALQKLNPEISVGADFLAQIVIDGDAFYAGRDDRTSMPIREMGIQFQHQLDPYSLFKAAVNFIPWPDAMVELEEVYITWNGLIPSVSITVGRFRQNLGIVNRWHGHDLDQTGYPLAMELVLGQGGIGANGVSIKWFMPPLWAHAMELTLELTDGENDTLFAGEYFSVPCALIHLKSYWDLSENIYMELGLSGMYGVNNRRGYVPPGATITDEPWRHTVVAGADLTLNWSPLQQAKYRSLTWRTEYYFVFKETPDDLDGQRMSWGVYSYIDYQFSARWYAGVRADAALPTIRRGWGDTDIAWDVVPYVTFWQSEFVFMRLEYQHGQNIPQLDDAGALTRRTDNRFLLQVDFAAGPHKHEKY